MGKRRHHDKEEHIARKIRKLERKMDKVKRRRRRRNSTVSSDNSVSSYSSYGSEDHLRHSVSTEVPHDTMLDEVYLPEDEKLEASLREDNLLVAETVTEPAPAVPDVSSEPTPSLHPDILCILGEEPQKEVSFGPEIHKDLSSRWSDILINGLKDEVRKDILKCYNIPENLKMAQPPVLNDEIKAAVNENIFKRDSILLEKQKHLGCAIACIGNTITSILTSGKEVENENLKVLSHAGRLLCHMHYNETQTRRNFLMPHLNKDVKENIKDSKRDQMLFGTNLPDKLKSLKAISKTGAELKSVANKGKTQPKNKQPEASTSRALNWRGLPPPPPPPRRATARTSSTTGGRRQQPARRYRDRPTTRHANSGRMPRRR